MSGSNVHPALSRTDWYLDLAYGLPSTFPEGDPNIDDPVNDTGLGPQCGDLQLAHEFAFLLRVVCQENGESS